MVCEQYIERKVLKLAKIYSELGQCIYFLPLPKVTLSRLKIQTKNKQSHEAVQTCQIEYEIYLIFMLQSVSFDCRKSNQCVNKAVSNDILSIVQLCIIKI